MILVKAHSKERMQSWFDIFERELPGTPVRLWPDYDDPANVEFVIASALPPVIYAPPVVARNVLPSGPLPPPAPYCREYQSMTTVGGQQIASYGTACRQPDGSWRIVQ
jgi:hypothetical protein